MAVTGFDQQQATITAEAAWKKVVVDASARYGAQAPSSAWIEMAAREAVDELWTEDLRIRTYVPVLAMRRVREKIESVNRTA